LIRPKTAMMTYHHHLLVGLEFVAVECYLSYSDMIVFCDNPGYSFAYNFDIGPLLHDGNRHPNKI